MSVSLKIHRAIGVCLALGILGACAEKKSNSSPAPAPKKNTEDGISNYTPPVTTPQTPTTPATPAFQVTAQSLTPITCVGGQCQVSIGLAVQPAQRLRSLNFTATVVSNTTEALSTAIPAATDGFIPALTQAGVTPFSQYVAHARVPFAAAGQRAAIQVQVGGEGTGTTATTSFYVDYLAANLNATQFPACSTLSQNSSSGFLAASPTDGFWKTLLKTATSSVVSVAKTSACTAVSAAASQTMSTLSQRLGTLGGTTPSTTSPQSLGTGGSYTPYGTQSLPYSNQSGY